MTDILLLAILFVLIFKGVDEWDDSITKFKGTVRKNWRDLKRLFK